MEPTEFIKKYIKSPGFKQRLYNHHKEGQNYWHSSGAFFLPEFRYRIQYKLPKFDYGYTSGAYYPQTNRIETNHTPNTDHIGYYTENQVAAHELGHSLDYQVYPQEKSHFSNEWTTYRSYGPFDTEPNYSRTYEIFGNTKTTNSHDSLRSESYADLMGLRYQLQESGIYDSIKGGTFTKEHLNKFKKLNPKFRLLQNFNDDDIIWMMNNVASNDQNQPVVKAQAGWRAVNNTKSSGTWGNRGKGNEGQSLLENGLSFIYHLPERIDNAKYGFVTDKQLVKKFGYNPKTHAKQPNGQLIPVLGGTAPLPALVKNPADVGRRVLKFTPSTAKEALANDLKLSGKHLTQPELENIIKQAKSNVYKSYLPESNYYNRQIANGVSKDELSRLSNEIANNISGTDYVTFSPNTNQNWVAATQFKGPHRNSVEVNPSSFGSTKIANEVVEHEIEHAATNGVMPQMWRQANSGYVVVGDANPTIQKAFDYNQTIKPTLKQEVIEQMKSGDDRLIQHVKDVTNPQDLRTRAMVAERDAQRHGMDILNYYNHPQMHNLNMKQLTELYTPNTLKNYLKYFKVTAPIVVGAANKKAGNN